MARASAVLLLALLTTTVSLAAPAPHWEPLGERGCGGWVTSLSVSPHDSRRVLVGGDMLGIGLSEDCGDSWQPTFGLRSYEIGDFAWRPDDPMTVWVGTMSGPYVSHDGGHTWLERRIGMPPVEQWSYTAAIEDVAFDPNDVSHLLAFGGSSRGWEANLGNPRWGAVWESRDGGESWTLLTTITATGASSDPSAKGANIVDASFAAGSSGRVYAAVRGAGLFVSEDGGRAWADRSEGLPGREIERVVPHPTEPDVVWVAMNVHKVEGEGNCRPGGIFRSADAGQTWESLNNGLTQRAVPEPYLTSGFKALSVARGDPNVLVTGDLNYYTDAVFVTTNGGVSWRASATKKPQEMLERDGSLAGIRGAFTVETAHYSGLSMTCSVIDPSNPQVMSLAGADSIIRTTDGGAIWTDATAERVGDAWRGRGYSGLCATSFTFDPYRRGHAVLQAMDAGKAWETRDGMRSRRYPCTMPAPWYAGNAAAFARGPAIYVSMGQFGSNGAVARTRDGTAWDAICGAEHGLPELAGQWIATGIYALPDEPERAWVVFGGRLFSTTDGGDMWSPVKSLKGELGWIAADPTDAARFLVTGAKTCYETRDAGATFAPIGGPKFAGRVACDSLGRFYVAAWRSERPGLWRYADRAWTRLRDDYYLAGVAVDPGDPRRLIVATGDNPFHDVCYATGVWLSSDSGATWAHAAEGLPVLRGPAVAVNPFDGEEIIFGTEGRGYFRARWSKGYVPAQTQSCVSTPEDAAFAALDPSLLLVPPLRNGSMTDGEAVPVAWDQVWGDVEAARDTEVYKEAPASLRVTGHAGKSGMAFQQIEGWAGEEIRVGGFVRAEGDAELNFAVQAFDAGWTRNEFLQVGYVQGSADWAFFSKTVAIPAWAVRFNLLLLVEGEGRAWLDKVTLE